MLVKLKNSPAPTISTILAFCAVGGHYSAVTSANWVRVIYGKERNDWFTLSHREFNANFEIIKQELEGRPDQLDEPGNSPAPRDADSGQSRNRFNQ